MLSILCVRLTIKVKVGIPESFKVGWFPPKKTGSSHLKFLLYGRNIHEGSALILTLVAQFLHTQWKTGHFGTLYIHPDQK